MRKEVRVIFNKEQLDNVEKAKKFFNEKTRKKALVRVLDNFITINNLKDEKVIK